MTFSLEQSGGLVFFFYVHAWVLFKCSNLRKGTPAIDHRIWICEVSGQGERPLGCSPGTSSMKTAWLLMVNLWVVQSTSRWHLVTHMSLAIDFSQWNISLLWLFLRLFQIVIYLDSSGSWLHDARHEFQAGCVGFPKGFCGFFDIFIKPAFLFWHFGSCEGTCEDKNKNLIIVQDICKKGIILHVNTSLILSLQHIHVQTTPFTVNTKLFTSFRALRSECKQDGAELTTSDPSHQNVTNLDHKNSNHLTSVVFLLQTLSPCNNLTSLSTDSPEHLWCALSKKWENPFPLTWKWQWMSNIFTGLAGFTCKWLKMKIHTQWDALIYV